MPRAIIFAFAQFQFTPCDLLYPTDVGVCLRTLQNQYPPGITAGTIAVLHAVTPTDVQMALKSAYSVTSVCLRAWQVAQP